MPGMPFTHSPLWMDALRDGAAEEADHDTVRVLKAGIPITGD